MSEYQPHNRKLRKQPKMRRMKSATVVNGTRLRMPKTAKKRRRRNQRQVQLSGTRIKQFIFSARWISLGILSLCIYALYLTGMDENFYLTRLPIEGAISISTSEIINSTNLAGSHIFAADPNKAAEQIAQIPGVIAASVTLNWPNEVAIQIIEDSPIAVWIEGSNQYWITGNGRFIPARSQTLGLLFIESELLFEPTESSDETSQPRTTFVPEEVLAGALQLKKLRPNIEKLFYRPSSGLSFQDDRGWRVYFGTGTDMQQKLVVYETIVDNLLAQGITPAYVSVSNQEKPYYKES